MKKWKVPSAIRDHVEQYVVTNVLLVDGVAYHGEGGYLYGKPLGESRSETWYVCPRSGLLRKVKPVPKAARNTKKKVVPTVRVRVSDALQCRFFDDAWHLVTLRPLPNPPAYRQFSRDVDILLGKPVKSLTPLEARQEYGAEVYATAVRRLARRELSQYPIPDRWRDSPHRG